MKSAFDKNVAKTLPRARHAAFSVTTLAPREGDADADGAPATSVAAAREVAGVRPAGVDAVADASAAVAAAPAASPLASVPAAAPARAVEAEPSVATTAAPAPPARAAEPVFARP